MSLQRRLAGAHSLLACGSARPSSGPLAGPLCSSGRLLLPQLGQYLFPGKCSYPTSFSLPFLNLSLPTDAALHFVFSSLSTLWLLPLIQLHSVICIHVLVTLSCLPSFRPRHVSDCWTPPGSTSPKSLPNLPLLFCSQPWWMALFLASSPGQKQERLGLSLPPNSMFY